ncbi:hypothetical protein Dda_5696 [Drechslerella dactyloides]|uniref:VOC domain-containing protein n=1 Tax=Drechslerella dactyloides TaxID=74499 RepID=A0AAD6NJ41_DREDA|nr:hypothetical protein Dda_5696 [Drechslerella dactyloides]
MCDSQSKSPSAQEDKPTPTGFCWVEIPVTDMKRALKFYGDAFGWTSKHAEEATYKIVENSFGNLNGALYRVSEEAHVRGTPERVTVKPYIGLHSIKESLEKIKEAGGEIINPGEAIPGDMGYFADFYDSERNLIGIWAMKLSLDA